MKIPCFSSIYCSSYLSSGDDNKKKLKTSEEIILKETKKYIYIHRTLHINCCMQD